MPRSKRIRPSRAQKVRALKALDQTIKDENTPLYVKARAASALLNLDRAVAAAEDEPFSADQEDKPPVLIWIPDNGRDPAFLPPPPKPGDKIIRFTATTPAELRQQLKRAGLPEDTFPNAFGDDTRAAALLD